ncbi:MAG TPA: hypothetical protein PLQ42_09985 [Candidatus Hydrogenedentes bacterium]|jgi:hypothetical protein|nr:hypothetical protein [Candidatus Hydrogenedentota bacterium]HOM49036.1 hypothetical protein [Candidatus Hydrogenedentota bacterium]HOR51399.1 hypothetical protein [Candidatus Hydrogenedentota bacterium]HPK24657.1 hypothetical protein [Candidatus Hydrogenedentota bacterium]
MLKQALPLILITAVVTATAVLFLTQKKEAGQPGENTSAAPVVDTSADNTPPATEADAEHVNQDIRISKDMVDALLLGMTVEEVEALWGRISDEMESEYDPGIKGYTSPYAILWHTWNNPDGTRVKLGFINRKLDRKHFYYRDGNFTTSEVDLKAIAEEKPGRR